MPVTYRVSPYRAGAPDGDGFFVPWNGLALVTGLTDGDTLLLGEGHFVGETKDLDFGNITVRGQGIGKTVIDANYEQLYCLRIRPGDPAVAPYETVIEDLSTIRATRAGVHVGVLVGVTPDNYRVTVRRVRADDNVMEGSTSTIYGAGFSASQQAGAVQSGDIVYEDCEAHGNGRMGFDTVVFSGSITRRRCKASYNGWNGSGGGFYHHGYIKHHNTWTLSAGAVWSHPEVDAGDGLLDAVVNGQLYRVSPSPTTTPATGYISKVGTTLYIRLYDDGDPNTYGVQVCVSHRLSVLDEDCEAWANGYTPAGLPGVDTSHGEGFRYDNPSHNVTSRRNRAWGNFGEGFHAFVSTNVELLSNLAVHNGEGEIEHDANAGNYRLIGFDLKARNCTSVVRDARILHFLCSQNRDDPALIENCAMVGGAQPFKVVNEGTIEANHCAAWGVAAHDYTSVTATNMLELETAESPLDDEHRPLAGSALLGAGKRWWTGMLPPKDVNGALLGPSRIDIGAFQVTRNAGTLVRRG